MPRDKIERKKQIKNMIKKMRIKSKKKLMK